MLSKNQRKQILQLSQKKYRQANALFVAEGEKVVGELLAANWSVKALFSTQPDFDKEALLIRIDDMKSITHFKSPSPVLGVFKMPKPSKILNEPLTIAVEGIRDPGNLGTLLRLCDWSGLHEIVCSAETVDCFNPKVIQASMGSIARVQCHYVNDLGALLNSLKKPMYAASANGASIYQHKLPQKASYIFGSESHGISSQVSKQVAGVFSIPAFKSSQSRPESLNIASATAIFLSELLRSNAPIQK